MVNLATALPEYKFNNGKPSHILIEYNLNGYITFEFLEYQKYIDKQFSFDAVELYE